MTIHRLNPERQPSEPRQVSVGVSFQQESYALVDTVVNARALQALEIAVAHHPIYRSLRCAARGKLEELFDDLALKMGLTAQRLDMGTLLLDGTDVFVHAEGKPKSDYCACSFNVWAASPSRAQEIGAQLYRIIGDRQIRESKFIMLTLPMLAAASPAVPLRKSLARCCTTRPTRISVNR